MPSPHEHTARTTAIATPARKTTGTHHETRVGTEAAPRFRRLAAGGRAALVSGALAISGCATYQAPTRADAATATLQVDPNAVGLRIVTLDGLALTAAGAFLNPFSGRDPIKLSPGPHRVNLEFSTGDAYRRAQGYLALEFEAAAGKRYTVYERHDGTRFVAWITDGAGATVSKPSAR